MAEPLRVVVTGAAGQIAYSLLYQIASGYVFGPDTPLILTLLDIPVMLGRVEGTVMELHDCAMPLVRDIVVTDDPDVAFKDIDAAFLVGAMPRRKGMERKDLLEANVKIFKEQGAVLDRVAKKSVKVLVVGNPANTNALICSQFAPSIPKENFSAMTRLDQNRALAQLAIKAGVPIGDVKNAIIWGNHSNTQFPDASHAIIQGKKATEVINDSDWFEKTFIPTVQNRGAAIINVRELSSALSAAKAASDHMKSWFEGTKDGEYVSMAVISDGSYGSPAGTMFSFPVTIKDKKWTIVQGLTISAYARGKLDATGKELCEERDVAAAVCNVKA